MPEHIRINDISPRIRYLADGAQTAFTYPFPIFADADLDVFVDDVPATPETDYAVAGAGADSGGTVTFSNPPADGAAVTLVRNLTVERTTDFQESGEFRAKVINDELDKIVAMLQEAEDAVGRSVRLANTDNAANLALPATADRANTVLAFDAAGDVFASPGSADVTISTAMTPVVQAASLAAGRAAFGLEPGVDVQAHDAATAKTDAAETVTADWTFGGDVTFSGMTDGARDRVARDNTILNAFEIARLDGLSTFAMVNTVIDGFEDETGVDTATSANETYDASGDNYTNSDGGSSDDGGHTEDGTGNGGNTIIDRSWALANGKTVEAIGVYSTAAATITVKACHEDSSTQFDIEVSESFAHGGTGWETHTLAAPFAVPGSGTYRLGTYAASDTGYANGVDRAIKSGDATGDDQSGFTSNNNAVPLLRAHYAAVNANMSLVSNAITAASAPAELRMLVDHEDTDGATLNTDAIAELSRDGGTTWSAGTLVDVRDAGGDRRVLATTVDVSGQPAGTDVRIRFRTANDKAQSLHAWAVQADVQLTV